jgi:hypothetical protein
MLAPVGVESGYDRPEAWRVIELEDVGEFMGNDVAHQRLR